MILPERSAAAVHVEDAASGLAVDVALRDAADVVGQAAGGYLVYPRGHASGATVLHRAHAAGSEDYISFERRPAVAAVAYQVSVGSAVRGLRLVAGTLEMIDAQGAPRLRVAPPYIVGADGTRTDAALLVEGCAVDTNPAGPWGRAPTPPGAQVCTVRVTWNDDAVAYPAVLDPRWTTTGSMTSARQGHTAIVLANGKVLVAGGSNGTSVLATAELFDRLTGTWAATGSMTGARQFHAAVQLNTGTNPTTSGMVLVTGGLNGTSSQNTAQLYSPSAGTWAAGANLPAARHQHSATLLSNGRVLIAGGLNGTTVLNTAATYDPAAGSGTWTAVANMASARRFHTATLISTSNGTLNNKVLVVGGNSGGTTSLATVELFDGTSAWTTLTALSATREGHTATVLANGNVVVTGGRSGTSTLATAQLFNPSAGNGSWTAAGTMTTARQGHTATPLPATIATNGQVLVAGGSNGTSALSSAELFNGTSTWTATTVLPAAVQGHTATRLPSNAVLIAGGVNGTTTQSAARIYDPSFALSCTTASQCTTGFCVNGVCCDTACNGGCGVCNAAGNVGTCTAASSGTVCRAGAGTCDPAETCNGSSLTCPANAFASATTVCRAAAGECDPAETCTGSSAACPADILKANGTACTDDGNVCTRDQCNGTTSTCQHPAGNAGTICRASSGVCDVAETCTGSSTACPANAFAPATTVCRAATAECDVAESCTGASGACPADALKANGTACADDGNACTADRCSGSSAACQHPAGNAGTICRSAAGACDLAETCTGTSTACPANAFAGPTTVCRAAVDACDVPESCTGAVATCPADALIASGTPCADDGNVCTLDQCSGTSAACQHPAGHGGTVCRAAAGQCDIAETCTGSSATCPVNAFAANGTTCSDGNACTQGDVCSAGVCAPGTPITCAPEVRADLAERVMKMEFSADWTVTPTGTLGSVPQRTGGEAGLGAAGIQGFVRIQSRALPTLTVVTTNLSLDVRLPQTLATESPFWYGQALVFIDAPSVGINNVALNNAEFTGMPLETFRTVRFTIPDDVAAKMRLDYSDLTFTVALNVPQNNTGAYIIDELRFGPASANQTPTAGDSAGERAAETLSFDPATGRVTILPIAGGWGEPKQVTIPAMQGTTSACAADFDGDGTADILFASPTTGHVSWLARQDLQEPAFAVDSIRDVDIAPPAGRAGPMACDDIDGDGDVDVVTSFSGQVTGSTLAFLTYTNDGQGNFARAVLDSGIQATAELAGKSLGDFNADGKLDLVMFAADAAASSSSQVFIFTNSGTATPFSTAARTAVALPTDLMVTTGPNWGSLTAVDFNRDGKRDLWVLGNSGTVFALQGLGNLTFSPPLATGFLDVTLLRHELTRRDIDGDGLPDLVVGVSPDLIPTLSPADRILATRQLTNFPGLPWFPGRGGPILLRPRQIGNGGIVLIPGTTSETRLDPPWQPATNPVGLVKGRPVVSSVVTSDGVRRPSLFLIAVNGHLLQRLQQVVTNIQTEILPPTPAEFPPGTIFGSSEACGGTCGAGRTCVVGMFGLGSCRSTTTGNQIGNITVTKETRWIWVDHGTPKKTILDGTPAVIATEGGARILRKVIVRGLNGHAYAIDPDFTDNFNLANSGWIDLGLPPAVTVADGTPRQTSLANAARDIVLFDIQRANDRATVGMRPRFAGSPSVVLGPTGATAFMMDTLGRLQQIDVVNRRVFNRGGPLTDGVLGDGSPAAVSWFGTDNLRHVEVYVIDALRRPRYLQLQPGGTEPGGTWLWRAVHPLPLPALPSLIPPAIAEEFYMRQLELHGTPSITAYRTADGVLHRTAAMNSGSGIFVTDTTGGVEGRTLDTQGRKLESTVVIHVGNEDRTIGIESPPQIMVQGSEVAFFARDQLKRIIRAQGPLATIDPASFRWAELPPAPNVNQIEGTVDFMVSDAFGDVPSVFLVRADGTVVDGDLTSFSGVTFHDVHRAPGTPQVIASIAAESMRGGCKRSGFLEETVFPQWTRGPRFGEEAVRDDRSQVEPGSALSDEVLYAENSFNAGFEADKPRTMAGVVIHTRHSPLDNPFDHSQSVRTFEGQGDRTVVAHDWNAKVAPDIAHQQFMTDGNIEDNGQVEIEWEQGDQQWSIDALPFEGDTLAVRGRHIFDCGHPPYKTEIHPPTAVAVVHENTARLFFSPEGGPTWFQPVDPLLPEGAKCSVTAQFSEVISDLGFWDKVALGNAFLGCGRGFDLAVMSPDNLCYEPYEHGMLDVLNDNEPLEFDVPLPQLTPFDAQPTLAVGGALTSSSVQATFQPGFPGRWHVSIQPANMPAGPALAFLGADTNPRRLPGFDDKTVEVCFQRNGIRSHDHHVPAEGVREFLEDVSIVVPLVKPGQLLFEGAVGLACGKDDTTDEPAMSFGANGRWVQRAPWNSSPSQCVTTKITGGDVEELHIQAHGFECDVSCGEVFDDDIFETPDDREGLVDVVFTLADMGIAVGDVSNPVVHQVVSQPDLTTTAQRLRTAGDYGLAFSLRTVFVGSPP